MAGLQAIKDRDFSRVTFFGERKSCQCPKCDAVHEWGGDPPAACECGVVFVFRPEREAEK
jgi:hypothetical protein